MSEAWDVFWLTVAWVGFAFAVLVLFIAFVGVISVFADKPEKPTTPEVPMYTWERGPKS